MAEKIRPKGRIKKNLTGQKFNRWTVLYETEPQKDKRGYNMRVWHCICDCGTEKDVLQSSLLSGKSMSCGCFHKEAVSANFVDITGKTFGRWTVLHKEDTSNGIRWYCRCICGTERLVNGAALRNGSSVSCGCYTKERTKETCIKRKMHNTYDLTKEYGIGYLSNGMPFYFDKEDYDLVRNLYWQLSDTGYLVSKLPEGKHVRFHRIVMKVDDPKIKIDHIGHNLLDNRKGSLRIISNSMNTANGKLRTTNSSGHTGVFWIKGRNKWRAEIVVNYKNIYLGYYDNINDAIAARKIAEDKYFGEYSYSNSMALSEKNKIKKEGDD